MVDAGHREAKSVFNDPFEMTINDPDDSADAGRYLSIGLFLKARLSPVL